VRQWLHATRAAYQGSPDTTAGPARVALRRVEGLLAEAERITAVEAGASRAGRSPGRVEEVWHRTTRATFESARDLEARRSRSFERWAALRERLALEVDDAERLLGSGGGLGYREARALRAATYQRDAALRLASAHDYGRAADAAEQALSLSAQVEAGFESLHQRFRDPRRLRQWRAWAEETVAASKSSGRTAIVVDKLGRRLKVYDAGRLVATFHAELGVNGLKEKRHAGDKATPEGRYRITEARQNGATRYYKALLLDYPNVHDRARFASDQRLGLVPARAGLGGLIEIHGDGGEGKDWTDGCVALRNSDMDSLFRWSQVGTPVTIVGTL
jgi:L,D-peptidoglycan transpeptidase YkuD (ErfK/YbiS/YcfS/YnhG family)